MGPGVVRRSPTPAAAHPAYLAESVWPSGRRQGRSRSAGQSSPADSEWGLETRPNRNASGSGPGWSNPLTELAAAGKGARQSSPADSECQWGGIN